jgi:toxin ParE1/3/4
MRWLTGALGSLAGIHARIAVENAQAAKRVTKSIRLAAERLKAFPASGRIGRIAGTRELVVQRMPYIIVYRIHGEEVQILRVFHDAIDWPHTLEQSGGNPCVK